MKYTIVPRQKTIFTSSIVRPTKPKYKQQQQLVIVPVLQSANYFGHRGVASLQCEQILG